MALAMTVDKLDEIPEALREHYVEKNGKFILDTDTDPRVITARKEAEQERRKRQELERAQETLRKELEESKTKRAKDEGDEETAAQRYQRLRLEKEEADRKAEAQQRDFQQREAQYRSKIFQLDMGSKIRTAAQKIRGLSPSAVEDAVMLGMAVFREDDQGKIAAFDASGERLLGRNGEDLTIDEWIADRRTDRPHWFEAAAGGGSGNQGGGAAHQGAGTGPPRARPRKRSEMTAAEKAAAIGDMGIEQFMALPE